jgi:ankyrin repeat protein
MIAVKRKDEELVRRIISLGADPDAANSEGVTARSLAVKRGPKKLLKILCN